MDNLNGNLGSFDISSTGNFLFAKFDSDGSVTRTGFLATIHYEVPTTTMTTTTPTTTTTTITSKTILNYFAIKFKRTLTYQTDLNRIIPN